MAGMRDRLIHGYFGIDYYLVWETVEQDIPTLKSHVQGVLDDMDRKGQNEQ
ncbi:MAG: HepT-like ribonuclease domain-containing protein [Desulfatiglandaceae bacterium]